MEGPPCHPVRQTCIRCWMSVRRTACKQLQVNQEAHSGGGGMTASSSGSSMTCPEGNTKAVHLQRQAGDQIPAEESGRAGIRRAGFAPIFVRRCNPRLPAVTGQLLPLCAGRGGARAAPADTWRQTWASSHDAACCAGAPWGHACMQHEVCASERAGGFWCLGRQMNRLSRWKVPAVSLQPVASDSLDPGLPLLLLRN